MPNSLLIIITASIAIPKGLSLLSLLIKEGYNLEVILTKSAQNFTSVKEVKAIIKKDPYLELFSEEEMEDMNHIKLSRDAELVLVYPATANFINKMAQGIADDLASNTVLACNKDICIAPAMNVHMWENPVTQNSLKELGNRGVKMLGPNLGQLACGEVGLGRLFEPEEALSFINDYFALAKFVRGKKILITAGATIEPLDPVRYISNYSSGKQGVALACYFKDLGAEVILVKGKTDCLVRQDLKVVNVGSAQEMYDATFENLPADIVICAAAVADYRSREQEKQKIKKNTDDLTIKLVRNPDILKDLGHAPNKPKILVGFAAESENLEKNARKKLIDKNCDVIIANDVSSGKIFNKEQTKISIIGKSGSIVNYNNIPKYAVGSLLLKFICSNYS